MARFSVFFLVALLAACGAPPPAQTVGHGPSMHVVDAALAANSPGVALQVLEQALKVDPRNLDALVRQGKAQIMLGNAAGAEVSYRRAIAVDGTSVEARIGLGKLLMERAPNEAEAMFAAVVVADPANVATFNNLGVARDLQGKHTEAQVAYQQALALNPQLASARQNLALSFSISGRASEGASMLSQIAMAGVGGRKARDNLAVALELSGESAQATKVLREELSASDAARALVGYRALKTP